MAEGWSQERCYSKDDFAGDTFNKQGAGEGWVFAFMNIQRFKQSCDAGERGNVEGFMAVKRFWREMMDMGAAMVGLSDAGLVKRAGKGGQYDLLETSGKEWRVANQCWGGEGTVWGVSQGTRTTRGKQV